MKSRKIIITVENRDSSDSSELVLQIGEEVRRLTVDFSTQEEDNVKRKAKGKKEKKRDEITELQGHDVAKKALDKNEEENFDQEIKDRPEKKEKATEKISRFLKEGYKLTVTAITKGAVEGLS